MADRIASDIAGLAVPLERLRHLPGNPMACLANSADVGSIVLDPFLGSGSTLIACCETGRTAYGAEIDPHYADVICARYQAFTGEKPVLASTGEPHDFTSDSTES